MAQLLMLNPGRRRGTSPKPRKKASPKPPKKTARRRRNPIARSGQLLGNPRRRRNPIGGMRAGGIMKTAQNGFTGAMGAFATDIAWQNLPIPLDLKTGVMGAAVKGLTGVGIGMLVSNFMRNKRLGMSLAEGAVTVQLHAMLRGMAGETFGLDGHGGDGLLGQSYDYGLLSRYSSSGMNAYVDNEMGAYVNAAPIAMRGADLSAYTDDF